MGKQCECGVVGYVGMITRHFVCEMEMILPPFSYFL